MINSTNLILLPADLQMLKAALVSDASLEKLTGLKVEKDWANPEEPVFWFAHDRLTDYPEEENWWVWFVVDKSDQSIIGNAGFKGPPDFQGSVEIGYEVAPARRNRGFASELVQALSDWALTQSTVERVIAITAPGPNPSCRVLEKCKFTFLSELEDVEDDLLWLWESKQPLAN